MPPPALPNNTTQCRRGQLTTRKSRRFSWTHMAAERRPGMLFADEAVLGTGAEWELPPAARRGHGTAAEVVAFADVTVPTAVEDVARVKHCSILAFQSRAPPQHFSCVFSVLLSILSKVFLGHHSMDLRFFRTQKRGSSDHQTNKN